MKTDCGHFNYGWLCTEVELETIFKIQTFVVKFEDELTHVNYCYQYSNIEYPVTNMFTNSEWVLDQFVENSSSCFCVRVDKWNIITHNNEYVPHQLIWQWLVVFYSIIPILKERSNINKLPNILFISDNGSDHICDLKKPYGIFTQRTLASKLHKTSNKMGLQVVRTMCLQKPYAISTERTLTSKLHKTKP